MNDGNVIPLSKKVKIEDFTKDLRPISLTHTLSKVAEHFIVHKHVKPAILKKWDLINLAVSLVHQ